LCQVSELADHSPGMVFWKIKATYLLGLSRDKSDDWALAFVDAHGFRVVHHKCHDQIENGTLKAAVTCKLIVVPASVAGEQTSPRLRSTGESALTAARTTIQERGALGIW
jgi:hypothetical protein